MAMQSVFQQVQRSCDLITNSLRKSSLNFSLQETPFYIYITVRKSFSKQRFPIDSDFPEDKASNDLRKLRDQSDLDRATIEKYVAQNESDRDTIEILESKVEKGESELYNSIANDKISIQKNHVEIDVLKGVLKNKNAEYSKLVKAHEKEIYRVEQLNENQGDTIINLREACKDITIENNRLQKTIKKGAKKNKSSDKNSNLRKEDYEDINEVVSKGA